ncbi:MAG: hypothetical protein HYX76_02185 [Acidobacteria bacterium]|nr:hypothetical protein [Acidobacteriota bacterium]
MTAALITAVTASILLLIAGAVIGFTADSADGILRHTSLSIFATLIVLLSHSMTIFYLIGKGKAIREAVAEVGLPTELLSKVSAARGPVFSSATIAIALTMATAILGGGVDTATVPSWAHLLLALAAVAFNLLAFRRELRALVSFSRITGDVDRLLDGRDASPEAVE